MPMRQQLIVQGAVRRDDLHIRPQGHQGGVFVANVLQGDVPVPVLLAGLELLGLYEQIRHAEDGRDQKHRQEDAQHRHPALPAVDFGEYWDEIKIVFHRVSLPSP